MSSPERELQKLKKNLVKSRKEIADLQKRLQASLLKKNDDKNPKPRERNLDP